MHVFIIAAVSVDGFIAPAADTSSIEWTSKGDKQFFRDRTKQAGVMVMGRTTFETIGRPLKGRQIVVMSSQPKPEKYAEISDSQVRYTSLAPAEIIENLEAEGYAEVAICGGSQVYSQFMAAGLVETMYLTLEPIAFGAGISLFNETMSTQQLNFKEMKKIDEETILLEYKVKHS